MYKDHGIYHVHRLTNSSSLQFVQNVAMDGQLQIDTIALPVERIVKIVVLLTTSQNFVENLNTQIKHNPQ